MVDVRTSPRNGDIVDVYGQMTIITDMDDMSVFLREIPTDPDMSEDFGVNRDMLVHVDTSTELGDNIALFRLK